MKKVTLVLFLFVAALTVAAQRCKGTNKKGMRCGITVGLNKDSLCKWHDTTMQCGADRANGMKCKFPVDKPGEKCRYHKDSKVLLRKVTDHRGLISVIYYDPRRHNTYALDYLKPRKFRRLFDIL